MTNIFKGFRQVLASSFSSMESKDKVGYLWLVRPSAESPYGDIYFGSRHYGHFGDEADKIAEIQDVLVDAGIVDESGNTVDIATLIQESMLEGGVAISIDEQTVSVNVADATENVIDTKNSKKNFLKVNEENELEVKGVDADVTVTSSDIMIEGGPLAELAKQAYTDGTLPSGTTIQDFLMNMLCVEKWSATPTQTNSFTTSLTAPTVAIKDAATNASVAGTTVEIGTKVKVAGGSANSSSAAQSITVKTMDYGYKIGEDGEKTTDKTYTVALTPDESNSDKVLKMTYGTLKTLSGDSFVATSNVTKTNEDIPEAELYVPSGASTVYIYQSGSTYTAQSDYEPETLYISTNLSNFYKEDKATDNTFETVNPWATETKKTATASRSAKVTGARAYFYGWMEKGEAVAMEDITSDIVRGLQNSGLTIEKKVYNLSNDTEASQFIIAFPSSLKYTVSAVNDGGALDAPITDNFEMVTVDVESANAYDTVSYDVWQYTPVGNAWDPRTLKITIA